MKNISGQLELKYIKAKNLKIKRSRFCGDHVLFGSHSVDWVFGSLVVAIIFLLFRWLVPFLFTVFIEAFLLDLTGLFFSPQSLFDGVRLRLQNFPRIQWAIYVACARVSETCVSLVGGMTQLIAALMRCDKLLKL